MEMGANDYTVKGFFTPRQILSKIKFQLIQTEPLRNVASFGIGMKPDGAESERLQKEVVPPQGYQCADCGAGLVVEMFPDYAKAGTHWFNSRLACPQCGKPV
jgi:hypothetical protein